MCYTPGRERQAFEYKKFCFSQRDSTPCHKLGGLQTIEIAFSNFASSQVQNEGMTDPELAESISLCVISHSKRDGETLGALTYGY